VPEKKKTKAHGEKVPRHRHEQRGLNEDESIEDGMGKGRWNQGQDRNSPASDPAAPLIDLKPVVASPNGPIDDVSWQTHQRPEEKELPTTRQAIKEILDQAKTQARGGPLEHTVLRFSQGIKERCEERKAQILGEFLDGSINSPNEQDPSPATGSRDGQQ